MEKYKIYDYKEQIISKRMIGFYVCEKCNYIHIGQDMVNEGYKCKNCGTPSKGGMEFFELELRTLIDLMQDLYNSKQSNDKYGRNKKRLSVVIFYTTIGEILINQFLKNLLKKECKNDMLQKKMINDSISFPQKLELYKVLTGNKFIDEIKVQENKYRNVIENYRNVRKARNNFLHEGYSDAITDEMPKQCLDDVMYLVNLFVELNNKYCLLKIEKEK